MKKLLKNKTFDIILYVVELIGFIALFILEYLSKYKAGVMKHLYFKKMEYLAKVYTQDAIMVHSIIVVALLIGLVLISKSRFSSNCKTNTIIFAVYSIILIFAFYNPYIKELNTYAYILILLETSIIIQVVKIIINK